MAKTITFNNGEEDKTLTVTNCFAYTYNALKTVLKLTFSESDTSFTDVEALKQNTGDITYLEDGEVKSVYIGYAFAENGFICNYADGIFNVEITQTGALDRRVSACEEAIESLMMIIGEMGA